MGNHYAQAFPDARSVILHYAEHRGVLHAASARWRDAIFGSSLPAAVQDTLAAQPALIRSPTSFCIASGEFFGFEGVLGESSLNWNGNIGGSCPLNCTHVWNYEQAIARIFPSLERSMRETDWNVLQAPEGYLPHRVLYPLGEQHFGRTIGGPDRPALDGMLGTVLKTYREARMGAGLGWLERYLPNMRRLMDYVQRTWDGDESGLLEGDQPVTHDISLQGVNMYVGGIWLAALRTMEAITGLLGHQAEAVDYARRFTTSSAAYDGLLWNGEFYGQRSTGGAYDFGARLPCRPALRPVVGAPARARPSAARRPRTHRPGLDRPVQPARGIRRLRARLPVLRRWQRRRVAGLHMALRRPPHRTDPVRRRGLERCRVPGGRASRL